MTHVWAIILGLVQGATEFLPISSSAHLTLIPWAFRISDPVLVSLQFDVALHAGSAIAILVALWGDWSALVTDALARPVGEAAEKRRGAWRLIGFLVVTSIPGAIFGVLLEKKAETAFRSPLIIGATLIIFGVLLWAVDRLVACEDPIEDMTWGKAFLIGVAQAIAIVPGVSRSGATITTGRAFGLAREAIAKYSFMAALPIIAGAAIWTLRKVPVHTLLSLDYALGFFAAAVSSFVAMRLLLAYVKKHSLAVFMYYRVAIGVLVIALFLARG